MIGTTLHNRYLISGRLGKGAMGTVYRATDAQTGKDVAVKLIARELAFDADMLERFKREGEALRQLRHPNIVGFVDAFQYDEQYAIVLEYAPGGSLHELVKKGPMPIERAQRMALELCDALTRAHHLNIVHRDIKPENVMLDSDGTPKLTDFGVARLVSEGNRLTGTGTQIGTPYYMSPEAWEGKPLDAQADIWSLGVVLYEMLSGEVPFGGETLVAVMNKVLTAPLPDLKTKRPDVPVGLAQIVRRMLTREKDARYRSMREIAADLERGGPATAVAAPPTAPVVSPPTQKVPIEKTPPRAFAHSGQAVIGVVLSLLGTVIGPGLLLFATENYLKGPLGVIAALVLVAAVLLGLRGLHKERSQPSQWGRLESGLSVGLGGLAGVAFLAIGLITVAPRFFAGGSASAGTAAAESSPSPVFITEGTLGAVLFEDNFDDGPSLRWDFQPQRWQTASMDGRTVLLSDTSQSNAFVALKGEGWTDYTAQFDFKFLKPDEHNAYYFYLRFRATDCPPTVKAMDDYVTLITTDVVELRDESCETQRQEQVAQSDRNIGGEGWHTAQVIAIGNRVRLLIDGEQYFDYTDSESPHLDGGVTLDLENKVELAIDNFRVNEIIPGEAAATSTPVYVTEGSPGEVLFEDDFESGASPKWELDPEWKAETVDGQAVLHGAGSKDGNLAHLIHNDWTDYLLQSDFYFLKPDPRYGDYHVAFFTRATGCPPGVNAMASYTVQITLTVTTLQKGTCDAPTQQWTELGTVQRTVEPGQWHTAQISLVGNRVRVSLDGEELFEIIDEQSPLLNGGMALVTSAGSEALFDNVRVTEIIPGLACAPGQIKLFSDDFEDGDMADWGLGPGEDGGPVDWTVQTDANGNHVLAGSSHQWATVGSPSWTDYSLQVKVRAIGGGHTHLNIHVNSQGRYYMNFPNGNLYRDPGGKMVQSLRIQRDEQWHTVRMLAVGQLIRVWLDDKLAAEYEDAEPLGTGAVGLEALLGGTMWYDDVLVCTASAESAAPAAATASPPEAVNAALADPWGAVVIPAGVSMVLSVASDLSGPLGTDQRDAVQLAVEERGTIAGFIVTLSSVDDKCSPEGGQAAAQTMTETGQVVAIVGTTCSSAMSAAMPILDSAHIVVISPSTSGNDLSQNGWLIFNRLALTDALNPGGNPVADPNLAAYKEFAAKFKDKFGRDCCAPYAAEAYDAAMILLKYIEAVAVVDENGQLIIPRQALAQLVRSTKDYEGLSGKITLDANGDRVP